MLFSSLSSAIIGVLVAFTSTVAAQDQIPLVCHSGIQVIALPGANVTNGTYGLSATFVNSILGSVANSSSISLNYLRNHTAANARTQFLVEVNDGTIALQQALANYTAACPTTPIVLHGYSEGGVVLANTICGGATPFAISSPAPTTYLNNVIAVIYYGEETRNAGLSYDLGGCETGAPVSWSFHVLPRTAPKPHAGTSTPKLCRMCTLCTFDTVFLPA